MNEKNKDLQEQEKIRAGSAENMELSQDDLNQVSGGIITKEGAAWLTEAIRKGKAEGSTRENVAFYARYSSGKGPLAHSTGKEAEKWVLDHWDKF